MKNLFIIIIIFVLSTSCLSGKDNYSELIKNNNDFAFSLFSKINEKEENNIFISPFSISTALAMTYDGAKSRTAREMRKALNFYRNQEQSHKEFTGLLNFYRNLNQDFLNIANAAVAQENYPFLDSYLKLVANYNAKFSTANFRSDEDREKARIKINKWVADNTNNKIEELLDSKTLDAMTRLVLLNAIYFKADWNFEFDKRRTQKAEFFSPQGKLSANFMKITEKFNYYETSDIQMIELPYRDSVASMYIIMHSEKNNINEYITDFDLELFNYYINNSENQKISLSMPKFKMETDYELKDFLKEMGMIRAFNYKADFRGMTGHKDLMIDQIIHKAFIEVDEKGTEAAAATAVVMREKSMRVPVEMNLNRPFIFIIKEHQKNSILFAGKLTNPVLN